MNQKIIIIIILLIVLGISFYCFQKMREEKMSKELKELVKKEKTYTTLKEINYSSSGNSNGNVYEVTLDIDKEILKVEEKAIHSDPLQVKEYKVTEKEIKKLLEPIEEFNLPEWRNLEYDYSIVALDGPGHAISFTYDNSATGGSKMDFYRINFETKIPEDGRKILYDYRDSLLNLIKEENLIKEYQEK